MRKTYMIRFTTKFNTLAFIAKFLTILRFNTCISQNPISFILFLFFAVAGHGHVFSWSVAMGIRRSYSWIIPGFLHLQSLVAQLYFVFGYDTKDYY